jgi:mono/diheme cytochrome c family protein
MKRVAYLLCLCCLAACEKAKQDMYDQPKYKPFRRSELFADGNSSRPLPENSVLYSKGPFAGTSSGRIGSDEVSEDLAASNAKSNPYPVTMQLLRRGQNRYEIYCMPCHSPAGDGDGLIARRGFPHPPSYHSDRLRQAPDRHIFDVISNGYGIMYSYADRVAPPDRWAIVAYIRVLQLSQHADAKKLPPDARQKLASAAQANGQANDTNEHAAGPSTVQRAGRGGAR